MSKKIDENKVLEMIKKERKDLLAEIKSYAFIASGVAGLFLAVMFIGYAIFSEIWGCCPP